MSLTCIAAEFNASMDDMADAVSRSDAEAGRVRQLGCNVLPWSDSCRMPWKVPKPGKSTSKKAHNETSCRHVVTLIEQHRCG
jgi:hypothetical protein